MQFNELMSEVKGIGFSEVRKDADNYFEAVIVKDMVKILCQRLERFLGLPVWPGENRLSPQIEQAINEFGGIADGQTLYFCHQDNDIVFAMLWPWADGMCITVKVARKGK